MWAYIIIFIISAFLLIGISCVPRSNTTGNFKENDSLFYPIDSSAGKASRADVENRLKALAESEVPAELNPGAMCYEMSAPPDRIEYVCPVCGEKTIYTQADHYYLVENVNDCRHMVTNIKSLDLRLEEKNFCRHCDPDSTEAPSIVLYIKYKGENKEEKIPNVSPEGLQLLYEFMNGDKTHSYFNEREEPLKDHLEEISNLLRIKKP